MLWNAVEAAETTKESRLARMFVVALPVELNHDQQTALLTEYIRQQFVADGMCADVALHDPDPPGHNPHAHILLTMRPLDEHGDWQYKPRRSTCASGATKSAASPPMNLARQSWTVGRSSTPTRSGARRCTWHHPSRRHKDW